MKPAKWMNEPMTQICHAQLTAAMIAKALRVTSTGWRKDGWTNEARVIMRMAESLDRIAAGDSPAKAFDWRLPVTEGVSR